MAKEVNPREKAQFWLLAAFVVVLTAGVMVFISRNSGDSDQPKGANALKALERDDEVLEVQPLIPTGRIVAASWREGGTQAPRADAEVMDDSLLDGAKMDPFGEDSELARKKKESLRKTIDRIHGLGVYVAPADDDDK